MQFASVFYSQIKSVDDYGPDLEQLVGDAGHIDNLERLRKKKVEKEKSLYEMKER